ncbi:MAG: alcohol dehydrogenase catalytic domain-containing protein [Mucilaginibacter sp.]
MKSAVLEELNILTVKDVQGPVCGDGEAIIEPQSVSVCGSDVRIFRYGNLRVTTPTVIGHEVAGLVTEVGKNVTNLKVGDRIVIGADVPDMESGREYTLKGQGNLCPENYAIGYQLDGAFQQKMKLNDFTVKYGPIVKIPDSLSYDEACIAEPLACAIHGLELAQMSLGKSICVIGLGPIGCMILELSKYFGAGKVFAAQRSRKRLEIAREFLPDARFIATEEEDLVETILRETDGEGVDLVITTAGTTKAQEDAIQIVKKRGYVNLFAGLKNQPPLVLDSNRIHYKECFIMGSHGSTLPDVEKAVQLLAAGKISAKKYISKTFPLSGIEDAFMYHESRAGMKVIVKPQQGE